MPRVFIPSQLRDLTQGIAVLEIQGNTVRELVAQLETQFPGIQARLCRNEELAPGLQVSIDGSFSIRGLRAKTSSCQEVHFLPAFGGG